jgi:hypothetical protein
MNEQPPLSRKARAREELRAFLFITLYLAVFLGSFNTYRRLILAEEGVSSLNYGLSLIEAMILAKIVLLGDALKLGRSQERRSLLVVVLLKALLFSALAILFTVVERLIEALLHGGLGADLAHRLVPHGADEMLARLLMMFTTFLPFFGFWELRRLLGPHRLSGLFLSRPDAAAAPPPERR